MGEPMEIARKIEEMALQIERLKSERPKILADLFQAEDDGDSKVIAKIRDGLRNHDASTAAHEQRKADLEAELLEAIEAQIAAEVADLPQTEKLLEQEIRDVGAEIGELLARAEYLQRCYGAPVSYSEWETRTGPDGKPVLPPENCQALFGAIQSTKGARLNELRGSDPNAEGYNERRNRLRNTREVSGDAVHRRHLVEKRKAVITNEVRKEMQA